MTAPVRLAVLGDPLAYTLSPVLHRAGLAALGLEGTSEALRTPRAEFGATLARLETGGYIGVNLTHPLKEEALAHLTHVTSSSTAARSVNTVHFASGGRSGTTTDGAGFVEWLGRIDVDPARARVVLVGAGGVARSVALALTAAGARVLAGARNLERTLPAWTGLSAARLARLGDPEFEAAFAEATLVVNAIPVTGAIGLSPKGVPMAATLVDLGYGSDVVEWVTAARTMGRPAHDGLGMLIAQARGSFEVWFGAAPPFEVLARAVGWPR